MSQSDVLIVGAGPTGLALALFLARAGVKARIIDKNPGPGLASRAMVVQARTLEFYQQLGFAEEVVAKGIQIESIHLRSHGKQKAEFKIADFGEGLSPYPFVLSFPQDDHERLLFEKLTAAGVNVEWDTELTEAHDLGDRVEASLRLKDSAVELMSALYVCGCDGAHSTIRQDLKLAFTGGTYDRTYFVADVEATGDAATHQSFNLCVGGNEFLIVMPVRSSGMSRLIGIIPEELKDVVNIGFEDVRPFAEKASAIEVEKVNWFSTYRVHHRVAEHFRVGRLFVAGDAGHIHSPVGGQGMNTGIGDAINLAWKLAAVVHKRADVSILDTYEPERIAFAHSLVTTTDRLFQLVNGSGIGSDLFRNEVLPHLAPFALGFAGVRSAAFRLISQTKISYHQSDLSSGVAGEIHGGDRLPWVQTGDSDDNFRALQSVDWQIHVYGAASPALLDAAQQANLALHEFAWSDDAAKTGLKRDALYLIRPDGYVALADPTQDVEALEAILARFAIAPP